MRRRFPIVLVLLAIAVCFAAGYIAITYCFPSRHVVQYDSLAEIDDALLNRYDIHELPTVGIIRVLYVTSPRKHTYVVGQADESKVNHWIQCQEASLPAGSSWVISTTESDVKLPIALSGSEVLASKGDQMLWAVIVDDGSIAEITLNIDTGRFIGALPT